MRVRIVPAVLSVAVTGGLLFGGWFAYDHMAVKEPLSKAVSGLQGVVDSESNVENGTVYVSLKLAENADLRSVYKQLTKDGQSVLKGRKLQLIVSGNTESAELDKLWSSVLFDVAEAMETKAYSDIPEALNELTVKHAGMTASTEMDETNVYVTLRKGEAVKYIILPRTPATLEVWNDAAQL
ncbi:hypothetical protein [Paenibacillus xylaniclasticus]|uniref:hypothetical protein n=1 Tax=Paenibacillus xylaniclasticus TaxID=588083 RepID=UPI000FDB5018|nr:MULTISPECIES: hypothetical protein [Paenibacillus]GFN30694.1 hypothetical protein PCURB6_09540 [Paenibacillus curdlanolyticus]